LLLINGIGSLEALEPFVTALRAGAGGGRFPRRALR